MKTTMKIIQGICTNCDHNHSCGFLARAKEPVWFCEEFDDSGAVENTTATTPDYSSEVVALEMNSTQSLGICSNCDNLSTCKLPKAVGGLWHCEEYN
ncbi:MAG: hypothetical protein K9L30_14930 [Desulfobacterales bacterium]|nr:hypothetical protein [Desulfobacterales bacterium]